MNHDAVNNAPIKDNLNYHFYEVITGPKDIARRVDKNRHRGNKEEKEAFKIIFI